MEIRMKFGKKKKNVLANEQRGQSTKIDLDNQYFTILLEKQDISFEGYQQFKHIVGNEFESVSNDPYIVCKLNNPKKNLSICLDIQSPLNQTNAAVYFTFDEDPVFTEERKILISTNQEYPLLQYYYFEKEITWLRIDPVDCIGVFEIKQIEIHATNTLDFSKDGVFVDQYGHQDRFQYLTRKLSQQQWNLNTTILFVTHEMSETGAPLLCRKMSAKANDLGMKTIIVSLMDNLKQRTYFEKSCSSLFVCQMQDDFEKITALLAEIGVRKAVLNTVVTGRYAEWMHRHGYRTISLIHEMKCSCQILKAHRHIQSLANYADTIVFPSETVKRDFLSFESNVVGKIEVRPQGYYKEIKDMKCEKRWKDALIKKLGLSPDVFLIAGSGAINFGKGVDLLPLIAAELNRIAINGPKFHFIWLGSSNDHSYEIWLKNQIHLMGLSHQFHFLGFLNDEQEYLQCLCSCDVFALTSREDSMPSAMIEAMTCELPVIAFRNSGGAQEALSDGRGILTDYLDLRSYARSILDTVSDNTGKKEIMLSAASRYVHQTLSFREYVQFILSLFE